MISLVKNKLKTLNLNDVADDEINFTIEKVKFNIKNFCNIKEVPEGLKFTVIDMVSGEILKNALQTGKIESNELKSVQVGDTNISFIDAEDKTKRLLDSLLNKESELLCYRKINW